VERYNRYLEPYEEQLEMFKTKQDEYNSAMTAENTRKEDFFANLFEPEVVIPERPYAPWVPQLYDGVTVEYTEPDLETLPHEVTYLAQEGNRQEIPVSRTTHLVTHIVDGETTNIEATGAVWGIAGQGGMAMPNSDAKSWNPRVTDEDTGIAATD